MPVYLIREGDTDRVKIGWSRNPERRCDNFRTHHSSPLTIIRTIEGPRRAETWMHHRFADRRINREWFTFCAEMLTVEPVLPPPKAKRLPRPVLILPCGHCGLLAPKWLCDPCQAKQEEFAATLKGLPERESSRRWREFHDYQEAQARLRKAPALRRAA